MPKFHATATWRRPSGRQGKFSRVISARSMREAQETLYAILDQDDRRKIAGKLDTQIVPIAAPHNSAP